jgi:hypothetical protein
MQQYADTLLWCFLFLLIALLLPLTVLYVIGIARAGQNVAGMADACGNAFYGFVVTNCAFNWVFLVFMSLLLAYLWAQQRRVAMMGGEALLDARSMQSNIGAIIFLMIGIVYAVMAITALAIVPEALSRTACAPAISSVSWGSPLIGVIGYVNLALNLLIAICCFLVFSFVYIWTPPQYHPHYDYRRPQYRRPQAVEEEEEEEEEALVRAKRPPPSVPSAVLAFKDKKPPLVVEG